MGSILKKIIMIFCVLLANKTFSQSEWMPLNSPLGLNSQAALILPDSTIYIGTQREGLFKSTDYGESWFSLEDEYKEQGVISLSMDNSGNIYSHSPYGLYKYDGESWIKLLDSRTTSFSIHPNGNLYAGRKINSGFIFSTDQGESWTDIDLGSGTNRIDHIFIDSLGNIFAGTGGSISGNSTIVSDVFYSLDNGDSWKKFVFVPGLISDIAANSNGTVLVSTFSGLLQNNYKKPLYWNELLPYDSESLPITISVENENDFIAVFFDGYLKRSTDDGETWENISENRLINLKSKINITDDGRYYVACLGPGIQMYNPESKYWETIGKPFSKLWLFSLALDNDRIIAGTEDMGIYLKDKNKDDWDRLDFYFPQRIENIYVANSGRYFVSEFPPQTITMCDTYYSDDKGETWNTIDYFENIKVNDFLELESGVVLVASEDGLFFSNDLQNWEKADYGNEDVSFSKLAFGDYNTIFAGTTSKGIYRSIDNGSKWESVNTADIDSMNIRCITSDGNGNVLAGPLYGGVYTSDDNGNSWTKVTNGYDGWVPNVLQFDENGNAYLLDANEGLFKSTDKGYSWENIAPTEGSKDISITGTLLNDVETFIASKAYTGGLYIVDLPTSVNESNNYPRFSIYPNPVQEELTIIQPSEGIKPSEGSVIAIYNILGEKVMSQSINPMSPSYRMNVEHLPKGMYFIKIGDKVEKFVVVR